jgi:hypothetical protein
MAFATGEKLDREGRPNLLREGIEELSIAPVLPVTKWVPTTDNGTAQAGGGIDFDVIGNSFGIGRPKGLERPTEGIVAIVEIEPTEVVTVPTCANGLNFLGRQSRHENGDIAPRGEESLKCLEPTKIVLDRTFRRLALPYALARMFLLTIPKVVGNDLAAQRLGHDYNGFGRVAKGDGATIESGPNNTLSQFVGATVLVWATLQSRSIGKSEEEKFPQSDEINFARTHGFKDGILIAL